MSATFPWGSHGLDKSRFEAYAKLLRLRNGGQIERPSDFSEIPDEQPVTELAELEGPESVRMNTLSSLSDHKLKKAFLDRLSELVANAKAPQFVSSSLMIEWEDRVIILVARNNGFREEDPTLGLLETIASSLRTIAGLDFQDPMAVAAMKNLWGSLMRSYSPRLLTYVDKVKDALKKTRLRKPHEVLHAHLSPLLWKIQSFRDVINDSVSPSTEESLEKMVQDAYDMYFSHTEEDFEDIAEAHATTSSLRNALGYLGRLKKCFNTFTKAATTLPNFQSLQLIPVRLSGPRKQNSDQWSVEKTFSSLGLMLDDETVKSVLGTGSKKTPWTKNRLIKKFNEMKSSISEVHSEVQVVLAIASYNCAGSLAAAGVAAFYAPSSSKAIPPSQQDRVMVKFTTVGPFLTLLGLQKFDVQIRPRS
ncbi:hypothetical protein H0H93_016490 [Arthromyces matolae]|nr:hypothetical protein H0H93_016490 [Arthromyces matolae]